MNGSLASISARSRVDVSTDFRVTECNWCRLSQPAATHTYENDSQYLFYTQKKKKKPFKQITNEVKNPQFIRS